MRGSRAAAERVKLPVISADYTGKVATSWRRNPHAHRYLLDVLPDHIDFVCRRRRSGPTARPSPVALAGSENPPRHEDPARLAAPAAEVWFSPDGGLAILVGADKFGTSNCLANVRNLTTGQVVASFRFQVTPISAALIADGGVQKIEVKADGKTQTLNLP